ncbi:MAG TPA: hypothetical protein VM120_26670 [Bryobacteraceae bacterium]|nr:hypothetical protein [Bryobacteraceae bacterium]
MGPDWIAKLGGQFERDAQDRVIAVSLRATWASDADIAALTAFGQLERLDLSRTRITDRALFHLRNVRSLQEVDLAFAEQVGDPAHAVIRDWKNLRRLNLRGTRVGDATAAAAGALTNLESLDLALTDVQDFGFEAISAAGGLKALALGGSRISEASLQFLRQMVKLELLDLSAPTAAIGFKGGMTLTDRSFNAIASLGKLKDLRLGYNRFPGRALAGLNPLERLGLEFCGGVGDEAVPRLAAWRGLKIVDLHGTKMTAKGVEELRQLRPDTDIRWE